MEEQLPVYLAWEPAHQPDVLLAEQKDSGIIDRYVLSHLQEFIPSQLMRHNKDLAIVTGRLLYYAMCALNGRTVGEEYANIFSVTKNQPQNLFKIVASRTQRLAEVCLRIIAPYYIRNYLVTSKSVIWKRFIPLLDNIDMLLFLGFGRYRSVSRQLLGLQSVYAADVYEKRLSYEIVALILLARLLLSLRQQDTEETDDQEYVTEDQCCDFTSNECKLVPDCSLCLSQRKRPTCTECGHVFCWKCITDWTCYDKKCPLCRKPLRPSRFILLKNLL